MLFLQRTFLVICNGFIVLPCLDNFDRYADRTGSAKFSLDEVSEKKNNNNNKKQKYYLSWPFFASLLFLILYSWECSSGRLLKDGAWYVFFDA